MSDYTNYNSPFLKKKEQAEVGRSPTLLALRYRYGGFAYPPGILYPAGRLVAMENRILWGILCHWISNKSINIYQHPNTASWKTLTPDPYVIPY